MSTAFRVLTEPATEPISLIEARGFLNIDFADADTGIAEGVDTKVTRLISAARKYLESLLGRALATQTIQAEYIIEPPKSGKLSGSIDQEPNWYAYLQALGANPFGIAMFYYDLPMPPLQSLTSVKYQYTVFDTDPNNPNSYGYWTPFTGVYVPDTTREPGRIWFQDPPTVFRWQFTYQAGYDGVSYVLPYNIRELMKQIIAYWYNNREGDPLPDGIKQQLINLQWNV